MTFDQMLQLLHIIVNFGLAVVTILVGAQLKTKIDLPTYQGFTREAYGKINTLQVDVARKEEQIKALEKSLAELRALVERK